uniref:1-alkyl-2-acetylglycerophosphocholine esterase n=1 Tax=Phallusia mammillata TaxID=59560 RepID=A0A6F9DNL8_9ASCI|nr:platelet-activating factor acetylhydrolase 2, cytoplasmic-like [Phallusia mammillata]
MPVFPKPSGPYAVGCSDLVSKCGPDRCLFRLFYPASVTSESKSALWLPSREYADGFSSLVKSNVFSWIFRYLFSGAVMHATLNADLETAKRVEKMPVIVFSHGLSMMRTTYSHICVELASKGAVVASVEHADGSATTTYYLEQGRDDKNKFKKFWLPYDNIETNNPNEHNIRNKQVRERADECIEALNHLDELNKGTFEGVATEINLQQFKGQLDLEKAAILGHSFGGSTTITTLAKDTRFKLGVALDCWMFPLDKKVYQNVPPVPFLFINSYTYPSQEEVTEMRKLDNDAFGVEAERKMVTIIDSNHISQTDFSLLTRWNWFTRKCGLHGPVNPTQLMKVNNELVEAFIGKHLGLRFGAELDDVVKKYKDNVLVGSNVIVDEDKVKMLKQELHGSPNRQRQEL